MIQTCSWDIHDIKCLTSRSAVQNPKIIGTSTSIIGSRSIIPHDDNFFWRLKIPYGSDMAFAAVLFPPFPIWAPHNSSSHALHHVDTHHTIGATTGGLHRWAHDFILARNLDFLGPFMVQNTPRNFARKWRGTLTSLVVAKSPRLGGIDQVEAGPIFSGHWIPYLFFRTSPDIIGYSCCPDFSGHVRRPTQLPKLTRLLTSAISVAI